MEVSNFMYDLIHQKKGAILGWERDGKKLLPTLTRKDANEAWGFSLIGGVDVLENFGRLAGIVTTRNERGMWLKVRTVRPDTPAFHAGLKPNDFITRINGRIVFHLTMNDVERLIKTSGETLLLDTERNVPKGLLYHDGISGTPLNFLYSEWEDRQIKTKRSLLMWPCN